MNLLAFLWLVGCLAAVAIAYAVPNEVWSALADRIRNPRPTLAEKVLMRPERDLFGGADGWTVPSNTTATAPVDQHTAGEHPGGGER